MNNDSILLIRRPRQASPRRGRTAAAIIATAGFALLATACGSSPSSTGSVGSANAGAGTPAASVSPALAFTRCVRTHGVPDYPDPDSSGGIAKETPQQLGVSDSQYQAAQSACQYLLPNGGQQTTAQTAADLRNAVRFAACMRTHGVPNWPDPVNDGGRINFDVFGVPGLDPNLPRVGGAVQKCQSLLHINLETIGMG